MRYADRQTFLRLDTDPRENKMFGNSIVACVRYRGNLFAESLSGTERGVDLTEPLPCNDKRDINTVTQTDGRDL
jgi:hypothetical protein